MKAVIFDLDGLLINSEPSWDKTYEIFIKKYKLEDRPHFHDQMIGRGLRGVIEIIQKELGLSGDTDKLLVEYREIFFKVFSGEKEVLKEGALELVKSLSNRGICQAVATGGPNKEMINSILEREHILSYFHVIVSSDQVKRGKPFPDIFLETAKELSFSPVDCVVLEDSANGILAAKAAGMRSIGVNSVLMWRKDLEKAGADLVLTSLEEVKLEDLGL